MPSIEAALKVAIAADEPLTELVADRFFPLGDARGGFPRITHQEITAERGETLGGHTGIVVTWLQLDCWDYVQETAKEARRRLLAVLEAANTAGLLGERKIRWIRCGGDRSNFERPTDASAKGVYRAGFDARICYCERS